MNKKQPPYIAPEKRATKRLKLNYKIHGEMERRVYDIIAAGEPWTNPYFQPNSESILD